MAKITRRRLLGGSRKNRRTARRQVRRKHKRTRRVGRRVARRHGRRHSRRHRQRGGVNAGTNAAAEPTEGPPDGESPLPDDPSVYAPDPTSTKPKMPAWEKKAIGNIVNKFLSDKCPDVLTAANYTMVDLSQGRGTEPGMGPPPNPVEPYGGEGPASAARAASGVPDQAADGGNLLGGNSITWSPTKTK